MRNRLLKLTTLILILLIGIGLGIFLRQNKTTWSLIKKPFVESFIKFDDTRQAEWSKDFEIIEIESSIDKSVQKSYSYKSKSKEPKPLIVSLHTWSGYYNQNDV
jgi:hypothetical protein